MADAHRAAQLVLDDAHSSRPALGLEYNPITLTADQHDQLDDTKPKHSPTRYSFSNNDVSKDWRSRRKSSVSVSERSVQHGAHNEWEPPHRNGSTSQHASAHSDHSPSSSRRGSRVSGIEAKRVRLLWWKAAGINCLFILAWYGSTTTPHIATAES